MLRYIIHKSMTLWGDDRNVEVEPSWKKQVIGDMPWKEPCPQSLPFPPSLRPSLHPSLPLSQCSLPFYPGCHQGRRHSLRSSAISSCYATVLNPWSQLTLNRQLGHSYFSQVFCHRDTSQHCLFTERAHSCQQPGNPRFFSTSQGAHTFRRL